MNPQESKLKRSPYLSQMTRTADTKMMAMLSKHHGAVAGMAAEGGVSSNFFELKRPAVRLQQDSAVGLRHSELRASFKKAASVNSAGSDAKPQQTHSSLGVNTSETYKHKANANANTFPFYFNTLDAESRVISPSLPERESNPKSKSARTLQYYYNTGMTAQLSAQGEPSRNMTFADMLDEGDGKEGDLNVCSRNEQWKAFLTLEAGNKRKCYGIHRRGQVVSASDLALLRRAACRNKIDWSKAAAANAALEGSFSRELKGSNSAQYVPIAQMMSSFHSGMKRNYTETVLVPSTLGRRVHTVSAGLAYGSEKIRMLNGVGLKNEMLEV